MAKTKLVGKYKQTEAISLFMEHDVRMHSNFVIYTRAREYLPIYFGASGRSTVWHLDLGDVGRKSGVRMIRVLPMLDHQVKFHIQYSMILDGMRVESVNMQAHGSISICAATKIYTYEASSNSRVLQGVNNRFCDFSNLIRLLRLQ